MRELTLKGLAEMIKGSYGDFERYYNDTKIFGKQALTDYRNKIIACFLTNYNTISYLECEQYISYRDFKILDRYNTRLKRYYYNR